MAMPPKTKPAKIKVEDFEAKVWATESVRLILRRDPNTFVEDYNYKRPPTKAGEYQNLLRNASGNALVKHQS